MTRIRDRLKERGITTEKAAEKAGMSADRLAELLKGAKPSMAELRAIAGVLRVSVSELIDPLPTETQAQVLFRSVTKQRQRGDAWSEKFLNHRIEDVLGLMEGTRVRRVKSFASSEIEESYEGAEQAAMQFREVLLRVDPEDPLLNLPELLAQQFGVLLFVVPELRADGASAIVKNQPFVFVSPRFQGRMLFSLAHEVGHLVAHHGTEEFALLDGEDVVGNFWGKQSQEELFADAFASALLLPREGVGLALEACREQYEVSESEFVGDLEILFLAHMFGVSFQAAAYRCEHLGLLPPGGSSSLYNVLRKKHGSPEKRAKEAGLPPRPEVEFPKVSPLLLQVAVEKIRAGEVSIGRASQILGIPLTHLLAANARGAS